MNAAVVIEVRVASDGRRYPATPLTHAARNRRRWLSHRLICRDQLSYREAQRTMLATHALRTSVGQIWNDLHHYACGHPRCPCVPVGAEGPRSSPRRRPPSPQYRPADRPAARDR